ELELSALSNEIKEQLLKDRNDNDALCRRANKLLKGRRLFHWLLEFPEVFWGNEGSKGFDAIIGNPPFYAGAWLDTHLGTEYRRLLVHHIANGETGLRGTADLCVYFLLRTTMLTKNPAFVGLVLTNTVAEGDSKTVGLSHLEDIDWHIYRANPSAKWP